MGRIYSITNTDIANLHLLRGFSNSPEGNVHNLCIISTFIANLFIANLRLLRKIFQSPKVEFNENFNVYNEVKISNFRCTIFEIDK